MKLISKPFYAVRRHQIKNKLPDNASAEDVLDVIFGDLYNDSKYDVIYRKYCDKTPLQRFNMIWVLALTLLISPIQFIKNGGVGWTHNTRTGRFFLKITGEYRGE